MFWLLTFQCSFIILIVSLTLQWRNRRNIYTRIKADESAFPMQKEIIPTPAAWLTKLL
jgi:hypothetical protein